MPTDQRMCYFIPTDGYIENEGWRPSIVTEGVPGHRPIGTWPPDVNAPRPYFWGHDYVDAVASAKRQNDRLGLSDNDVAEIVASSMVAE